MKEEIEKLYSNAKFKLDKYELEHQVEVRSK